MVWNVMMVLGLFLGTTLIGMAMYAWLHWMSPRGQAAVKLAGMVSVLGLFMLLFLPPPRMAEARFLDVWTEPDGNGGMRICYHVRVPIGGDAGVGYENCIQLINAPVPPTPQYPVTPVAIQRGSMSKAAVPSGAKQ